MCMSKIQAVVLAAWLGIAGALVPVWASMATDFEEAKLAASDGAAGDYFGVSVAVSGDTAVVGAEGDEDNGYYSGSAYVFRYDGSDWVEEAKLTASDGAANDSFGYSVAVSGDTAVAGASKDYTDDDTGFWLYHGSAYVFRYDGSDWVEEAKLTASDRAWFHYFGVSVAVSGDTAVVGAEGDEDNGYHSGSAYVFRYDGSDWVEEAKLTASDGASFDYFGRSVAVSGDTAVVGAQYYRANGWDSGSAYVFRYDGSDWVEEAKLTASDGAAGDRFGAPVAISGDTAVVGAHYDDDNGSDSGSAYVFRYDGSDWVEEAKLTASDGAVRDYFGRSVAVSGDTAVVGSFFDDDHGAESGSAYLFRYDGSDWVEEVKLTASDGAVRDYFGRSVAVSGDTAVVGAEGDDDNGSGSGSAYVFRFIPPAPPVEIDIKPGSDPNPVNPFSLGMIPVAILTTEDFDALTVDADSVLFGPDEAEKRHKQAHVEDVDGDGDLDLLLHFRTQETGIALGDTKACVTGETLDGTPFEGCDNVSTQPPCGNGYAAALVLPPLLWIGGRRRRRAR